MKQTKIRSKVSKVWYKLMEALVSLTVIGLLVWALKNILIKIFS